MLMLNHAIPYYKNLGLVSNDKHGVYKKLYI